MTQEERDKLQLLRQAGLGYKKIAQELNLPTSTVKSFFRRSSQNEQTAKSKCPECGKTIEASQSGKTKKFCSDNCRFKWWNHHRNEMKANALCVHCGKKFHGRAGRKFCSHACYIAERFGGSHVS